MNKYIIAFVTLLLVLLISLLEPPGLPVIDIIPEAEARIGRVGGVNRVGGPSIRGRRAMGANAVHDRRRGRLLYADNVRDDRREFVQDTQRRRALTFLTAAAFRNRSCQQPVMYSGMQYSNCGGQWYQPSYQNGQTVYVTVNAPPGY